MAKAILMGRDGKLSVGGSEIKFVRDVTVDIDPSFGDTSSRNSLIEYGSVVGVKFSIEFEVLNKTSDVSALLAQMTTGVPLSITTDDGGGHGIKSGEFNLKMSNGQPLKGEGTYKFTATPCYDNSVAVTFS